MKIISIDMLQNYYSMELVVTSKFVGIIVASRYNILLVLTFDGDIVP